MSKIGRFVVWETSPSIDGICPVLANLLRESGVDFLHKIHGRELTALGQTASEIERLIEASNIGMVATAWWPTEDDACDSIFDESVEALELSVRSSNCLANARIGTIRELLRQTETDLLKIKNMGRKSLLEIQEKLVAFKTEVPPQADSEPSWFSLAALASFEAIGVSPKSADMLRSAGINDVYHLLIRGPATVIDAFGNAREALRRLQVQLARFRLVIGAPPPDFVVGHLDSFRSAFRSDLEGLLMPLEPATPTVTSVEIPGPAPASLEEELEALVREKGRDRNLPIIRRFLGWDGGTGTTLETTAGEFEITRERVRQVVAGSISKNARERSPILHRAVSFIGEEAPTLAEEVEASLVTAGIARKPFRLEAVRATARRINIEIGWEVQTRNKIRFVAKQADLETIERFQSEARRRVSHFGVTNKSYVLTAIGIELPARFDDLCCSILDGLRWLEDSHQWFWLPTARNQIESRLAKILRVLPRVSIEVAHAGVLRDRRMEEVDLPIAVFRSFCGLMPWCSVDGDDLIAREGVPDTQEDSDEAKICRILREQGPVMRREDLLHIANSLGIGEVSFQRVLSDSNVVVHLDREVYGLIGSTLQSLAPLSVPTTPEEQIDVFVHEAVEDFHLNPGSDNLLDGTDVTSSHFPVEVLLRITARSVALRQNGPWSLAELWWTDPDLQKLRAWTQVANPDLQELSRQTIPHGRARFDGLEAISLTFLCACADVARTKADEGEMWPQIQESFGSALRRALFHGYGVPKARVREATERLCSKLRIRHLFGREGEQSWRRTVFLQFGFSKKGWQRLPWWLTGNSAVPVTVEDLLQSAELKSGSFGEFWRTLQRYRAGKVRNAEAKFALQKNPWAIQDEVDDVLAAALERRDLPARDGLGRAAQSTRAGADENLLAAPLLHWTGEAPEFELPFPAQSRWLSQPRYVMALSNGKRIPIFLSQGEYQATGKLTFDLSVEKISVDLLFRNASCLPEPLNISLTPDGYDFAWYDLSTGRIMPFQGQPGKNGSYGLLARCWLEVTHEAEELRRVFDGNWLLRAYRCGLPDAFELRKSGHVVFAAHDESPPTAESLIAAVRVECPGGTWGESAPFTVRASSDFTPTHLLIAGHRFQLEPVADNMFRAKVTLSPEVDYGDANVTVECVWRNRVRWLVTKLLIGPIIGIAIETEGGWKSLTEHADVDAEYLRRYPVVARPPTRISGEEVAADEWAWMEGPHFCGRPGRAGLTDLGRTVYSVGDPLVLSPGAYNRPEVGYKRVARSVIHSGVIERVERTDSDWAIQLRQAFDASPDHEIWVWLSGCARPVLVDRSAWRQEDSVFHVELGPIPDPLGFGVSFEGHWLGARTAQLGWAGFSDLIQNTVSWTETARSLKWWRLPLLHPVIRTEAMRRTANNRLDTLLAWLVPDPSSPGMCFSEEYEEAWGAVVRTLLWDWAPNETESVAILKALDLLSGEFVEDYRNAWDGIEELLCVHPLLLVQAAVCGTHAMYQDDRANALFFLEKLRNRILSIDRNAAKDDARRALSDCLQRAAGVMNVDQGFVTKSLLRDAVALVRGCLERSHNLKIALGNSYAVPQYIAAALLEKMIVGEV